MVLYLVDIAQLSQLLLGFNYYHTQWIAEGSVFLRHQSVGFFVCVRNILNHWTDLLQIHTEDVFGPLRRQVWRSKSKIKGQGHQGQKQHFSALLAAFMRFMFGKTSLGSSIID